MIINKNSKENFNENRMNYVWEANRLASFKSWPFKDTDKCNKQKMAEAGFFSVATKIDPDAAQCFMCHKELNGWESNDDPWHEHTKHSPKCHFVTLGKKELDITIYEFIDIIQETCMKMIDTQKENHIYAQKKIIKRCTAEVRKQFKKNI